MDDPIMITAGELNVEEIIASINDGRRIVVETEFLGSEHEITLRRDGETYYCDTPARLHKHGSEEEMRKCIRKHGYAKTAESQGSD